MMVFIFFLPETNARGPGRCAGGGPGHTPASTSTSAPSGRLSNAGRRITATSARSSAPTSRPRWIRCGAASPAAIAALRSLFRFAKKRGLVFTNPATGLKTGDAESTLVPMTDAEIRAVERVAASPARRLIVALAAVHAAHSAAIRHLTLDDLDLPNRRITIAGHSQRLGELTCQALGAWLGHRRTAWPRTPNRHVLISEKTALGTEPVTSSYLNWQLRRHGVNVERIRRDRVLHEALTAGPDPLHLALVFNLSHTTASKYAAIAQELLDDQIEQATEQRPAQPLRFR
jgi:integrase